MSFILDALKKLERQRPRGPVPDLHTVHGPGPAASRRGAFWAGLAAAVLLLNAAALLLWLHPRGRSRPEAIPAERAAPGVRGPGMPLVVAGTPPKPALAGAAQGTPPGESAAPPAAVVSVPAPASGEALSSTPVSAATAGAATAPVPTPEPAAPEPPAATPTPAGPGDNAPAAEAGTPKEIETLKISGLVFADDPAMRMIIIDNRVLREGDAVSAGLRVEEITEGGAFISLEGKRYQLGWSGK